MTARRHDDHTGEDHMGAAKDSDPNEGSWKENAKWVATTLIDQNAYLHRIEAKVDCLDAKIGKQNTRIAVMEVKAGFWGTIAGALAGIGAALFGGKGP